MQRRKDGGPWVAFDNPVTGREIIVKDVIADNFLQQILMRPEEYDVIATLNLNGDYISDALAAQVGGIGIAPGANIGDTISPFSKRHTEPRPGLCREKIALIPGSLILVSRNDACVTSAGRGRRQHHGRASPTRSPMVNSHSTWRDCAKPYISPFAKSGHTTRRMWSMNWIS